VLCDIATAVHKNIRAASALKTCVDYVHVHMQKYHDLIDYLGSGNYKALNYTLFSVQKALNTYEGTKLRL